MNPGPTPTGKIYHPPLELFSSFAILRLSEVTLRHVGIGKSLLVRACMHAPIPVLACQAQVLTKGFFYWALRLRSVWTGSQRQRTDQRSETGGKLRKNQNGVAKLVPQQRTTGESKRLRRTDFVKATRSTVTSVTVRRSGMAKSCPPADRCR